ncbi:MAG: ribbon-helix-helix domain-containing protein [Deltaproteobacteria bacterium]|nr:ribbon-helix-helix domain-containing protein [Deltaproteobacteria bacterium]
MKTVSFKLPELLVDQITSVAKLRRESRSSLVRKAIKDFIEKNKDLNEVSCLDLTRDLAGCVSGPEDLSFNKERLNGYGQ